MTIISNSILFFIICASNDHQLPEFIAELYTKKMFQLLQSAYSTISIQDTALFLGVNEENATNCKSLFSF